VPKGNEGPGIKKPDTNEALRDKGMSKERAAKISNAQANKQSNGKSKKRRAEFGRGRHRRNALVGRLAGMAAEQPAEVARAWDAAPTVQSYTQPASTHAPFAVPPDG
jgi:hypothetical protein